MDTTADSFASVVIRAKSLAGGVMKNRLVRFVTLLIVASAVTSAAAHPGSGIVVDRRGNVYFMDTGRGVWMIDPSGRLTPHQGQAFHWMAIDDASRFAGVHLPSTPDAEVIAVGANPTLILSSDFPVEVGRDGALYYPELGRDQRLRIIRYTSTGARSVRAVLPDALRWINGLAAGPDGSLYYTEDKAVQRIDMRGVVTTVAGGVSVAQCSQIPGIESGAQPYLRDLGVAEDGTLYVAASGCGAVVRITRRGDISTVLRTTAPWSPTAVAVTDRGIYVLEYLHTAAENRREWLPRVRKILPNGSVVGIAAINSRP